MTKTTGRWPWARFALCSFGRRVLFACPQPAADSGLQSQCQAGPGLPTALFPDNLSPFFHISMLQFSLMSTISVVFPFQINCSNMPGPPWLSFCFFHTQLSNKTSTHFVTFLHLWQDFKFCFPDSLVLSVLHFGNFHRQNHPNNKIN